MAILMVQEVRHLVASEASIRERPQSNDCPSPAERGIRKPFDRLPELALSDEALPDSGAGLLLGDKDLSLREHCAALACVCGGAKSFCSRVLKSDPLQAAPEAAIDVYSLWAGLPALAGNARQSAAHHSARWSGVHCRPWMYQCHGHLSRLQDAARGSASPDRHSRQQRHKEGSTRPSGGLRGGVWFCMGMHTFMNCPFGEGAG